MSKTKLRFHYWGCRGRVQAIRYMLEDLAANNTNVDYQEDFEQMADFMSTWAGRKVDPTYAGPFRTLPVLHLNEKELFGQTLSIGINDFALNLNLLLSCLAHVIAREFDLYGKVTSTYKDPVILEGYINGVVTCAYTDIISNALIAIWRNFDLGNTDSLDYYVIVSIQSSLDSLNALLKKSSTSYFYDQIEPTVADYFALEAFLLSRDIHSKLLPNNRDALEKLEQVMKQRPALANYFQNGRLLKRMTAAPHEDEYFAKIAQIK